MWTDVQKAFAAEAYILTKSYNMPRRLFIKRCNFDPRRVDLAPTESSVRRWVEKFRKEGSLTRRQAVRNCYVRTEKAIQKVADSVKQSPKRSVRRRGQYLGLKRTSLHTILKKDLRLHPYRVQICKK